MIQIRPATHADIPAIHALVHELAIFEKAPEAHTATIRDYENDLTAGFFMSDVAENEAGEILGMILYHKAYSTWRGRMMYLEDFVVSQNARNLGIGQMLFDRFVAQAKAFECKVVKWQVLDWNVDAIRFYERNGAEIEKEWYNGKILF